MNFLIVKTSSIGDIIQTFPVIEYLKKRDPECSIDWVVEEEYASLVQSHPGVHFVHTIATRRWRKAVFASYSDCKDRLVSLKQKTYDVVFDLQGNTKSAFLTQIVRSCKKVGFGWDSAPEWPSFLVTDEKFDVEPTLPIQQRYLKVVQQYFDDETAFVPEGVLLKLNPDETDQLKELTAEGSPRIMVAFASKWKNKCLSVKQLIQFLSQYSGPFYFVCGTKEERETADFLAEKHPGSCVLEGLSFPLWQRLMSEMELVISVDSAALALCGTTSTPSFSFFGPTKASVYKPIGDQHQCFQGSCPYNVGFEARCPKLRTCKTGACLKTQVFEINHR